MKILIVDDEFNNRELLRTHLQPLGECHTANDGEEAVNQFTEALHSDEPFDLVLLDIMMPIMDGQEALKQIRYAEKKIKGRTLHQEKRNYTVIYMVTSLDDPMQMIQSYITGKCNGYITKPVSMDDLINRLRKHKLIKNGDY